MLMLSLMNLGGVETLICAEGSLYSGTSGFTCRVARNLLIWGCVPLISSFFKLKTVLEMFSLISFFGKHPSMSFVRFM